LCETLSQEAITAAFAMAFHIYLSPITVFGALSSMTEKGLDPNPAKFQNQIFVLG
jgi:hypothetical protein